MAMVAGSVFATCRWLLALIPPLALRFSVKKTGRRMAAAGRRLLPPAVRSQRAGAALVPDDRGGAARGHGRPQPVLLRLLAWSALVSPGAAAGAVVGASFQLSFAAVLALMVVFEAWQRRTPRPDRAEPGPFWAVWRYLAGVSATTLVAGAATTPFAAFHFQTIPTYGVLANLVAVPLTSFW